MIVRVIKQGVITRLNSISLKREIAALCWLVFVRDVRSLLKSVTGVGECVVSMRLKLKLHNNLGMTCLMFLVLQAHYFGGRFFITMLPEKEVTKGYF